MKPRLARRPRAFSNLRPFARTNGLEEEKIIVLFLIKNYYFNLNKISTYLVLLCLEPGAGPKCLHASREFLGPDKRTQFSPFGDRNANWSNVKISPPAFKILARACSVTWRATTYLTTTKNYLIKHFINPPKKNSNILWFLRYFFVS